MIGSLAFPTPNTYMCIWTSLYIIHVIINYLLNKKICLTLLNIWYSIHNIMLYEMYIYVTWLRHVSGQTLWTADRCTPPCSPPPPQHRSAGTRRGRWRRPCRTPAIPCPGWYKIFSAWSIYKDIYNYVCTFGLCLRVRQNQDAQTMPQRSFESTCCWRCKICVNYRLKK